MGTLRLSTKPTTPFIRLGVWRSLYHYPSRSRQGIFKGEHLVQMHKANRYLIAESLPGSKSYVLIRLTVQENIATGSWHEQTNPRGHYKGAIYHGAIQLVISSDGQRMSGKWVGFGKNMDVNVGSWELSYWGDEPPL
jgi:hypothetical protein